jgi:serine/threonine-protein kinase
MAMGYSADLAPHSSLPALVRIGEVLAGKYRLDSLLGAGGMGVVVGATHLQLQQRIAIKFMSPLLMYSEDAVERFLREARLAARIQSEHVVRVFDVASLEDGTPYIVMEYLEGEDLRTSLQRLGRFSVPDAVDCVLQASEAIAEAHVAGVVHRDLKPGNLFACRRRDGSQLVKVLDFGVSKLLRKSELMQQHGLSTGPHVMMGSPLYSSPEQIRASNAVDARSDIWALGAILYELVSGRPPFHGATLLELCSNVMRATAPPLAAVLPGLPPEFEAVVARSLEKVRSRRFGTIAEFARALAPFAPSRSLLSVERIENVIRSPATSGVRDAAPPPPAPATPPCDKTLQSEPDPASGTRSLGKERASVLARRALWVGIAMAFGAIACATVLFIATSRWRRALPAATAAVAPRPPAAASRPPPEPAVTLAPITESAAPTGSSPRSLPDGRKPPARPRTPDTSQFGGLQ